MSSLKLYLPIPTCKGVRGGVRANGSFHIRTFHEMGDPYMGTKLYIPYYQGTPQNGVPSFPQVHVSFLMMRSPLSGHPAQPRLSSNKFAVSGNGIILNPKPQTPNKNLQQAPVAPDPKQEPFHDC